MRLSVIIPVLNAGPLLAPAVRSVETAQHPDVEVIVVDDGSSDGAVDGVRELPGVRVERLEGVGPGRARNHGLGLARAAWVAFLDADDLWLAGRTAALLEQPRAKESVLFFSDYWVHAPDEERRRVSHPPHLDLSAPGLLSYNPISTSTVVARRDSVLAVGGFHHVMRFAEDWDLWLRLAEVGRVEHDPDPWVERRELAGSLATASVEYVHGCRQHVIDRAVARQPSLYGAVATHARANIHLRAGIRLYRAGDLAPARRMLEQALALGRWRPTWRYLLACWLRWGARR